MELRENAERNFFSKNYIDRNRYVHDPVYNQLVVSYLKEYVRGYEDGIKSINTTKHETVEQWEERTGEHFSHDSLVYVYLSDCWEFMRYRKAINLDYLDNNIIVVKTNHGKPEEER